ncbi:MAG: putative DNA binding domain-containing protein [Armatimonadetes bacterium]|nr:putative DNA binding domain-containing protein [Armatimonadota bacterium]
MSEFDPTQYVLDFEKVDQVLLTADELFDFLDEENLRRWRENRRIEFKSARVDRRTIAEYICMWANTSPEGGVLVIGVEDSGKITGCLALGQDKINEIEKVPHEFCPSAKTHVRQIRVHRDSDGESDIVIAMRVEYHKTRVIEASGGKVFVRKGDSKFELGSVAAIRELQIDKGEVSIELEPCGLEYPKEFQAEAVSRFAQAVIAKKDWRRDKTEAEVLELMHLGDIKNGTFVPNLACALLFAKDVRRLVPGCRIRFLRFEGTEESFGDNWNATKDVFIDGTVPELIQESERVISSQLRDFSRLGTGGKFYSSPEYPKEAWYEAIVNACVHRSFSNGSKNRPIFVKMFEDRLLVESPGSFPPFVSPENIYDVHHPRNPYLMDAMFYLEYVKQAHEGTRRMKAEMQKSELPPPEFREEVTANAQVVTTLRNMIQQRRVWIDSDVLSLVSAQLANSLSQEQKRCLNFCAEHGQISVSDAQRLTSRSWPSSKKLLESLVKMGVLRFERKGGGERDPKARYVLAGRA